MRHFVRFVACGVICQDALCYHWSMHLSLARLTTVTRFWTEYSEISCVGYSPSWTPPHVKYSRRGDQTTPHTGRKSWRGCTTLHRRTSPSRWSVMWMLEDIVAPPIPWRWLYLRRVVQRWVLERSRCQLHGHVTPCRLPSELLLVLVYNICM